MSTSILPQIGSDALTDEQVIERVLSGETALYELIMRRYNQRLYRTVRAILRNDDEVEDVMQDAYVRAIATSATLPDARSFPPGSRASRSTKHSRVSGAASGRSNSTMSPPAEGPT